MAIDPAALDAYITDTALDEVLHNYPQLSAHGLPGRRRFLAVSREDRDAAFVRDRDSLRSDVAGVLAAAKWLATLDATRRATAESPSSYWLKHVMERTTGKYVTNGAFIAAALLLGLPIYVDDGPNPGIGVSRRSVERAAGDAR